MSNKSLKYLAEVFNQAMTSGATIGWLVEQYFSPRVIPKEQMLGYVKWRPDLEVMEIRIDVPENSTVPRLLNVDESVFKNYPYDSKTFVITKNEIELQGAGFVGFEAYYASVPESEIKVTFQITLAFEESHKSVELSTEVIRPIVCSAQPALEFFSSSECPIPERTKVSLVNILILQSHLTIFARHFSGSGDCLGADCLRNALITLRQSTDIWGRVSRRYV